MLGPFEASRRTCARLSRRQRIVGGFWWDDIRSVAKDQFCNLELGRGVGLENDRKPGNPRGRALRQGQEGQGQGRSGETRRWVDGGQPSKKRQHRVVMHRTQRA